ncbi:hypothetical protein IFM58399_05033 [Aspergillus lentulus]|uniref:uncharacterized protein n=1 Tax=Aspergillus lentulus TaxID=293939 RepID=UPI001393D861|nr:uncharacterized protein IFM58399_05033 [Aspergillus lentulus]GFF37844.1 hypothetical protein IFM58399_05033 [Aspergillus lentulus]
MSCPFPRRDQDIKHAADKSERSAVTGPLASTSYRVLTSRDGGYLSAGVQQLELVGSPAGPRWRSSLKKRDCRTPGSVNEQANVFELSRRYVARDAQVQGLDDAPNLAVASGLIETLGGLGATRQRRRGHRR